MRSRPPSGPPGPGSPFGTSPVVVHARKGNATPSKQREGGRDAAAAGTEDDAPAPLKPVMPGVYDNSSLASMDWPDMLSGDDSSGRDSATSSVDGGLSPSGSPTSSQDKRERAKERVVLAAAAAAATPGAAASAASNGAGSSLLTARPDAAGTAVGGHGYASGNGSSITTHLNGSSSSSNGAAVVAAGGPAPLPAPAPNNGNCRISFYCLAASFDKKQLEMALVSAYGWDHVRKYPEVMHLERRKGEAGHPGADVFFFDYGVVACWGLALNEERELVRQLPPACLVQPLAEGDVETDVFRCAFCASPARANGTDGAWAASRTGTSSPLWLPSSARAGVAATWRRPAQQWTQVPGLPADVSMAADGGLQPDLGPWGPGVTSFPSMGDDGPGAGGVAGLAGRRLTRRAEAVVAAAVLPSLVPSPGLVMSAAEAEAAGEAFPPPAGPYSALLVPPQIADDTITLHPRHANDCATKLAISYALAQSTKLSAFEKAVTALVAETQYLPDALAEHGQVHISGQEIGKMLGKVFVLKRSVNLLGSVMGTPEFFWYVPDNLQALYHRLTEYVELEARLGLLNGRFDVMQEMLELLRAQEENRHGTRLELIIIWLIVVEVVFGFVEMLEFMGVLGPKPF